MRTAHEGGGRPEAREAREAPREVGAAGGHGSKRSRTVEVVRERVCARERRHVARGARHFHAAMRSCPPPRRLRRRRVIWTDWLQWRAAAFVLRRRGTVLWAERVFT